ncbi:MAG: TrbI/VirB10 family protein [Acidobacteriia bacterium]|nr:TrbI/VirB10 family protein [Terriglobia bacterium]
MNEPIQEKAPQPPGLLPKHVQSWIILGLAVLMVLIMWLTGGKKQPAPARASGPVVQQPLPAEVNETKIADLQNRIQELQREQLAAQSALAQQSRLLGAVSPDQQQAQPNYATGNSSGEHTEDPIKAERRKREYLSLFASNIALSYRKAPSAPQPGLPESQSQQPESLASTSTEAALLSQMLKDAQLGVPSQPLSASQPNVVPSTQTRNPSVNAAEASRQAKEANSPAAAQINTSPAAAGKTYILFEGTVLESVLINRLDGQFSGPVECLLTNDIYSHDRQHLLIPAGSKVLGETKKVDAFGQTRLAVLFHRLIMPDGYSLSLDQFKGLNQTGDTGLRDQVNNHYLRIFGVSLAVGALGAVAQAGTAGPLTASGTDVMRQGFAQSAAQSSAQILDKFLNIMPTVTIREGHRVKVYLSGDLALPDYNNHKVPSDL